MLPKIPTAEKQPSRVRGEYIAKEIVKNVVKGTRHQRRFSKDSVVKQERRSKPQSNEKMRVPPTKSKNIVDKIDMEGQVIKLNGLISNLMIKGELIEPSPK